MWCMLACIQMRATSLILYILTGPVLELATLSFGLRERQRISIISCSWWEAGCGGFWCSRSCCISSVLVVRRRIRRANVCLWKRNLMQMKPAYFTLIRFHHVVTSERIQQPGNRGKDLRNVQKLKGCGSYGLSVYPFLKKNLSLLFFQQLEAGVKEKYSDRQ